MDVSRYNFLCQKALHQGLQYAKSFGHQELEVEHIALAMLRAETVSLGTATDGRLQFHLQEHLSRLPKLFGNVSVKFGLRLDRALDRAEERAATALVDEDLLWECLVAQSSLLRGGLLAQGEEQPAAATKKAPGKPAKKPRQAPSAPGSHEDDESSRATGRSQASQSADGEATSSDAMPGHGPSYKIPDKLDRVLKAYTLDLSALAERGELDPVIGRDSETRRVLEILGRKKKNNPLLIGEPGVGKTAIAEALALKIAEGRVPEPMRGKRVLVLDLASLVAGARYRGEFEERLKSLLAALQACQGEVILFIDEIHMLVGTGRAEGSADAANLLKPALARGELRCLGATTIDEYREYIEKDAALERRFQVVMVEEPSRAVALSVLRGLKGRYEVHHGVQINDDALVSAVDLALRFLPHRRLPDKAIDLLDEACSRLRLQIDSVPAIMDELRSSLDQLEIERKAIGDDKTGKAALQKLAVQIHSVQAEYLEVEKIWRHHQLLLEKLRKYEARKQELATLFENTKAKGEFEFAAKLQYEELPALDEKVAGVHAELQVLQETHAWLRQVVGSIEIAEVVAQWTRVPVTRLLKDESEALLAMEHRLARRVYGQERALAVVSHAIKRARVGVGDPGRPIGVFLFLGPTGVGKTETAKALAEEVFDDENRLLRIDMSEFMEQHQVARLIGAPPGYIGYGDGGELTEAVRHNPYTVVLFDEIEKAHPRVLDILLQTFDEGRLTDAKGRLVDFRHTVLIMTSNLPLDLSEEADSERGEEEVRQRLAEVLRPEFVARIDEVVLFQPLGQRHYTSLVQKLLYSLNERLQDRQFRVVLGPRLEAALIAKAADSQASGRALKRAFQIYVVDQTSERLLRQPDESRGAWRLELDDDGGFVWQPDQSLHRYLPAAAN